MPRIKIVILLLIFLCSGGTVYADREDVDSIIFVSIQQNELSGISAKANGSVGKDIMIYSPSDGLLSFSNKKYATLTVPERRKFMETALMTTSKSSLGVQIKNKTYNFIANQDSTASAAVKYLKSDVNADFASATMWFKPFGSVFGVVLGLVSLFIFMFIGLSTLLDIAYMVLPGFRVLISGGADNKRPRWVTKEAYSAVTESEGSLNGNYKGYMGLYFQRRIPAIIVLAIALGYLISGSIYDFVVFFVDSYTWV